MSELKASNCKWALGISIVALGVSVCTYFCPRKAADQDLTEDKLKKSVLEVIKHNPQALMDAMGEGMAKKREDSIRKLGDEVAVHQNDLLKMSLRLGDSSAKATIFAFIDPTCEHCMKFEKDLVNILKTKKEVGFALLPVAVIGPDSLILGKVYYAINELKPERLPDFIEFVVNYKKTMNKEGIEKGLKAIGLSYKDIEGILDNCDKKIADNGNMAKNLELPVVPAVFVIEGSKAVMIQDPDMDIILKAVETGISEKEK